MTTQTQPPATKTAQADAGAPKGEVAAHTPTPWLCASDSPEIHTPADASSPVGWHIAHINGGQSFDERMANAAFIVRACNSHAALVEALRMARPYVKSRADANDVTGWESDSRRVLSVIDQLLAGQ